MLFATPLAPPLVDDPETPCRSNDRRLGVIPDTVSIWQADMSLDVPDHCPFTIQGININGADNADTYLIRERDQYGEFPHIYAKICRSSQPAPSTEYAYRHHSYARYLKGRNFDTKPEESLEVIVLSDTGCGTEVSNTSRFMLPPAHDGRSASEPEAWNLRTFLEYTINPGGKTPYLVMTTHCHYDHIMGIGMLPSASTTVLSSSHAKAFISPYSRLQKHSLCGTISLQAPKYEVGIWAEDMSSVVFYPTTSSSGSSIPTPYTILHTPGHTPDSLSWYDADLRLLCVGDSFYVKQSSATRDAKWGHEPPMPVMFDVESDLKEWWASLRKILKFVREKNAEVQSNDEDEKVVKEPKPLSDGPRKDADKEAEEDGFVVIGASNASSEKQEGKSLAPMITLPIRPARMPTTEQDVPKSSPPSSQSQIQTGFDVLPPEQLGLFISPTSSTNSLLTPTAMPTHLDSKKVDSDPWMLINRYFMAGAAQRPLRTPPTQSSRPLFPTTCHVTKKPLRPRVLLCAAHTTVSLDAECSIVSMLGFMLRILKNEIPCKRVENGPRGEKRWLWDFAVSDEGTRRRRGGADEEYTQGPDHHKDVEGSQPKYVYSLLAPLSVIEEGRRKILATEPSREAVADTLARVQADCQPTRERNMRTCVTCRRRAAKCDISEVNQLDCKSPLLCLFCFLGPGREMALTSTGTNCIRGGWRCLKYDFAPVRRWQGQGGIV